MPHISPLFEDDIHTRDDSNPSNLLLDVSGADARTSGSDLAPALQTPATGAPSPLFNPALAAEVNRTGGINKGTQDSSLSSSKTLGPISAGLAAGQQFQPGTSGDVAEASAGVGATVIGGALTGALIGGAVGGVGAIPGAVIGGISALVISGTKAWFGVRNARKRNRALKELQRKAEKQRLTEIARDEKWRKINNFQTIQASADNRRQAELQNKWDIYSKVASQMTTLLNSDSTLNQQLKNQMRGVA